MDDYIEANRELWDAWTDEHARSAVYDLAGFKAGRERLRSIELQEVGDVRGKSLLHLQCHFGMDALAWARHGARVTGVDFSPRGIVLARSLSEELNLPAQFICSTIEDLPEALSGEFDIVYTSYGTLRWLRDLSRWGQVVAHFTKPGGFFYLVEDHPFMGVLDAEAQAGLRAANPYFESAQPEAGEYRTWRHSLGEILNSLIGAGLSIEYLHEFPMATRAKFHFMEEGGDGWWRLKEGHPTIPLLFSLRAHKAA